MPTTQPATPAVPPSDAAIVPRRSLLRRLFRAVMLLVVLGVAIGGALFYMEFRRKVDSEPYQVALKFVTDSDRAKAVLGDAIHAVNSLGALPSGELGENQASLFFNVAGAKAAGVVKMQARKVAGEWGITSLQLQTDSAADLNLTQEYMAKNDSGMPKFDPNAKFDVPKIDLPKAEDLNFAIPE